MGGLANYLFDRKLFERKYSQLDLIEKWKGPGERLIKDYIVSELRITLEQARNRLRQT